MTSSQPPNQAPSRKRKRREYTDLELRQAFLDAQLESLDIFEPVEELTLPSVVTRVVDRMFVHELVVPILKDDEYIGDCIRRDDVKPTDRKKDYARMLHFLKKLSCPICFNPCEILYNGVHGPRSLPCGHIFGASCINRWLSVPTLQNPPTVTGTCPKCRAPCTLADVTPLASTFPAVDQATSTRRFPLSDAGLILFYEFEAARRNVALIKWNRARKCLDQAVRLEHMYTEAWFKLWGRRKAPDKEGLLRLSEEVLRKAKARENITKALCQVVESYQKRVDAYLPRLDYFTHCCQEVYKFTGPTFL